jgi:putative peptidoglycan lipid II flippase
MAEERTGRAAFLVGSGIFGSRIAGLVRQSVFAHFFGASQAGDAFLAAFRIPNMLQNLLGEGVLSASFIPEYAGLLARGDVEMAEQVAGAVFGALALVASVVVLLGVLAAPYLVDILAGGFNGATRELTITLVRVLFPGAALLVFSAWCLGLLNSHRKFLVSYLAPVAWNIIMIGALLVFGPHTDINRLAIFIAWASVVGSAAQFVVQLPIVLRVAGIIVPNFHFGLVAARRVFTTFTSAFLSRGVVQISAFVDLVLASHLPIGTVSSLAYAQTLYLLPGSLFGMSVTAAELPAMSSAIGTPEEIATYLRDRLNAAMQRIAYYIVPCIAIFLVLGDVIIAGLLQTGHFRRANTLWVWEILAGSTLGLLASTLGRLDSSTYYALRDTRTPLNFAIIRILLTTVLGLLFAFVMPRWLGLDPRIGAAGLTASAGLAGWVEFILLRRSLTNRIGRTGLTVKYVGKLWLAAIIAAAAGSACRLVETHFPPLIFAAMVGTVFGMTYLIFTIQLQIPEALLLTAKLRRGSRVQSG